MERLKGKVAIVSGAAQGIGRAMCEVFAEEGAVVLVTDIDGRGAESVAQGISGRGGHARAARVDLANAAEIDAAVRSMIDEFGRVDVLCNNAAFIGTWHGVLDSTDEEWQGCLQATLLGTQRFTRAVLPSMISQRGGSIIVTSSIQGMVACPNSVSYTTAKAGLIGFSRSAACDYGRHNIRVNVIAPGPIKVGYSPEPGDPAHTYQINNTFLGRVGVPRDVACAALFLASDEAQFITGAVLPVDGGWTAM